MNIYLVRHGETDWNLESKIQGQTDTPLNENGRKQARELAEKISLEFCGIGSIYTSKKRELWKRQGL